MTDPDSSLPTDVLDAISLREYVDDLRIKKGYIVDKLPEAPTHVPGVDDVNNRFDWYMIVDDAGQTLGYFHAQKGIAL
jgi:hypothetical protein